MSEIAFILLLALFLGHELDAIRRHEWRLFPVISRMDDEIGYLSFLIAHIPVFILVFWLGFFVPAAIVPVRVALAAFSVIHIWLHWLFRDHPRNEFDNLVSQLLIWTTGAAGMLYLVELAITG